ncbi:DUF4184 family protein [Streptomyces jumonjinensis]|uniref:DUF4184 family protein n=1 Tax=Streptomyces jumonjinensis TaxID=1945 RepID=UPI0037AE9BDB
MPFTLSHAAAVLPGIRRDGTARGPLLASALVMGSFSPDMTYFAAGAIPGAMGFGTFTHAPLGVLTVDAAITAALLALWLLVRDPLIALLPAHRQGPVHSWLRGRPTGLSWRFACCFYLSAVLGATTHIVWDAFTHHDRWGTRLIPVLGETVAGYGLYTVAQYGSSALSLLLLGWFARSAVRRQPPLAPPPSVPTLDGRGRGLALAWLGGWMLAGAVLRCVHRYVTPGNPPVTSPLDLIPTACFGAGAGLAVGLVLYSVGMRLRTTAPERV